MNYIKILESIKNKKEHRSILIKEFQTSVWNDSNADKVLSELAYDLDYYEPDPKIRKEDSSFYSDERLLNEIDSTLYKLKKVNELEHLNKNMVSKLNLTLDYFNNRFGPFLEFKHLFKSIGKDSEEYEFAIAIVEFIDQSKKETALFLYPTFAKTSDGFELRFRWLSESSCQVVMMYDHELDECRGKGVPETAIRWFCTQRKCTILSSSNIQENKTSKEDQRGVAATKVWKRIEESYYDDERDQFVLEYSGDLV